jgi:hypothetical protein
MQPKITRLFISSAGACLLLTAAAKLISTFGEAHVLQAREPLLGIAFRDLFWLVGSIELAVGLFCLFGKRVGMQAALVAWLGTNFVLYRLGLWWVGYQKPCGCMGNLTDALHITPRTADTIMKVVLVYLLIGSYTTLYSLWSCARKAASSTESPEAGAATS